MAAMQTETRDLAIQLIMDHATRVHDTPVNEATNEIVKADSEVLLPFLNSTLQPSNYMDAVVMQQYLHFLTLHKIPIDNNLQKRFTNEVYRLSTILVPEWDIDFEERRTKAIEQELAGYAYHDYVKLFELCGEIQKHLARDVEAYQLMASIEIVLVNLAKLNGVLFKRVIRYLLQTGNKLGHFYQSVIGKLGSAYSSPRHAYNLLKKYDYNLRESWLLSFLSQLRPDQINRFYLEELYSLYRTADVRLLANFDSLEPYRAIDQDVIVNAVRIVFERTKLGEFGNFHYLFNPNTYVFKSMKALFADEIELLEGVYCYQSAIDDLVNHKGTVLKRIVEMDRRFLLKYLQHLYGGDGYLSEPLNGARYVALWELDDYDEIITDAVEFIFEKERSDYPRSFNYVNAFFKRDRDDSPETKPSISERMQAFIARFIEKHHADRQRMVFIFGVITECFCSERLRYLKLFLTLNQDPETFERLSIEPRSWGGEGSMVPVFEKKINFLESVLPFLSTTKFLKHRLHVNNLILDWKQRIEGENKNNFLGSF
jgi:hypothetical protein